MVMTLLAPLTWIFCYFLAYWFAMYVFVWIHALSGRNEGTHPEGEARGKVLVLVPSHHEGAGLVDTVRTLIDQDYEDEIEIQVLVEDFSDSTVSALRAAYPSTEVETGTLIHLATDLPSRAVSIVAVGHRAKHIKLNHALDRADCDFVALLDADHRARLDWIRNGVRVLHGTSADGVQFRKLALSTGSLAQIWDSGLSHVAFELFNRALQVSFGRVSFTGSTALFRSGPLREHKFSGCITEDTFLSYTLMLSDHRIVYDNRVGSFEEVTPNIPSFVFRRRRWSAGHTHAFFSHLPKVFFGGAPLSTRALILFNGQFFLTPVFIALFFLVHGLYYFALYPLEIRALVLGASIAITLPLTLWLSWRRSTKTTDLIATAFMVVPQVAIGGTWLYGMVSGDPYYYITSFPHEGLVWAAEAGFLAIGAATFVLAAVHIRAMAWQPALVFVLTFPLLIVFDLLSALYGFTDFLLQRRQWSRIDRRAEYSAALDDSLKGRLVVTKQQTRPSHRHLSRLAWVMGLSIALVATNEVLSVGPCGTISPFLWEPFLVDRDTPPAVDVRVSRTVEQGDLRVQVHVTARPEVPGPLYVRVIDQDTVIGEHRLDDNRSVVTETTWPLGWSTRSLSVSLSGPSTTCLVQRKVSTSIVEAGSSGLMVNGEPFTIKGMVPSFLTPSNELQTNAGFAQLKRIGVNAVRLYHPPTPSIEAAAAEHQMLLIPQPDLSTWDNFDPQKALSRILYRRRWDRLVRQTTGNPLVLLLNTGNELEIDDRSTKHIDAIRKVIRDAQANNPTLTTYSTFATFIDYPVDILGINMLDSGPTYWTQALALVKRLGIPFYASEFGGFVAFFERPTSALRQWRMFHQTQVLEKHGGSGTVFFASHDNWRQAVPPGEFNDPFQGEHPDDVRGFWDPSNTAKPELEMLIYLLSDVAVQTIDARIRPDDTEVQISVKNLRGYRLTNIVLEVGAGEEVKLGDLNPDESRVVSLSLSSLRMMPDYPNVDLHFSHYTHAGLRGRSQRSLTLPDPASGPVVVGSKVFDLEQEAERVTFTALVDGQVRIVVPDDWESVLIGEELHLVVDGEVRLTLPSPTAPVEALEMSRDGQNWEAFDGVSIGTGERFLRFRLPDKLSKDSALVMSGLAARQVHFRWTDEMTSIDAHPYRETTTSLAERSGDVMARIRRRRPEYLTAAESPTGESVPIALSVPFVFDPQRLEVSRGME
jgi:cellulose synthase/poly-beta-1,6-N-acetylglucosamine synthase-like glycosyltransferase